MNAWGQFANSMIAADPHTAARAFVNLPTDALGQWIASRPASEVVPVLQSFTGAGDILNVIELPIGTELVRQAEPRAAARWLRAAPQRAEEILPLLGEAEASLLRDLIAYPNDSAGRLMDPVFATFAPDVPVRDARRRLKDLRARRIHDLLLVDNGGKLVGTVPVQEVALAEPSQKLQTLASSPVWHVQDTAPRDEVLRVLQESRVSTLPVVDYEGVLIGVLRQAELIETAKREAASDMLAMVGASQEERSLARPILSVRKRLPWLLINLLTAFLAAAVVGIFEDTIATFTALAVLLPVVAGQSGNTGAQAQAVTLRGLTLREIRVHHWLRVAGKEMLVGIINGVGIAIICGAAVYVWNRSLGLTIVIAVSMVLSMMAASLSGAMIPVILTKLRQDPAAASSIILTTVTDVVGFLSFLGIATLMSAWL